MWTACINGHIPFLHPGQKSSAHFRMWTQVLRCWELRPWPHQLNLKLHLVSRLLQPRSPNLDWDPTVKLSDCLKMTSEVSTALLTSKENLGAGRPNEIGKKHETTNIQGQLEMSTWISLHAKRTRKNWKELNEMNLPLILHCNLHCCCTTTPEFWRLRALLLKVFELFKNKAPPKPWGAHKHLSHRNLHLVTVGFERNFVEFLDLCWN